MKRTWAQKIQLPTSINSSEKTQALELVTFYSYLTSKV